MTGRTRSSRTRSALACARAWKACGPSDASTTSYPLRFQRSPGAVPGCRVGVDDQRSGPGLPHPGGGPLCALHKTG